MSYCSTCGTAATGAHSQERCVIKCTNNPAAPARTAAPVASVPCSGRSNGHSNERIPYPTPTPILRHTHTVLRGYVETLQPATPTHTRRPPWGRCPTLPWRRGSHPAPPQKSPPSPRRAPPPRARSPSRSRTCCGSELCERGGGRGAQRAWRTRKCGGAELSSVLHEIKRCRAPRLAQAVRTHLRSRAAARTS